MVERLGDRAIRFARPKSSPRSIVDAVRAWRGVIDVVVAREHVAVYFADAIDTSGIAALDGLPDDTKGRDIELHATYDGADLDDVARACGMSRDEVITVHRSATYSVDTMGFAPGFAYLVGLDPRLRLPRQATPRPRVPAGALGIADIYTAAYPFDSPGGWHLLGRVRERMFDDRGALLRYGDRVRFV